MIKPFRPDGCIYFSRHPCVTVFHSIVQHIVRNVTGTVQQTPICFANSASFGPNPAQISPVSSIVPDNNIGLQFAYKFVGVLPIVIGFAVYFSVFISATIIASTSICAIKPYFENGTVVGKQFCELI